MLETAANSDIKIRLSSTNRLVPFRVGDRPRTEVCDYMEDCNFQCAVKSEGTPVPIQDTYDENFVKTNSVVIMKKVRDLFKEKMIYRRDHLIAAINQVKRYPIEHIYYALTRFVQNKNEGLVDQYGRSGYLVSRGEFYAFQPAEIMDEAISTFERSAPVDYKPVSLRLEVPKEIRPWNVEPVIDEAAIEGDPAPLTGEPVLRKTPVYTELVGQLRAVVDLLTKKGVEIKATQKDWYKHANKSIRELRTVHEMELGWIEKFVGFHYLDKLPAEDKLSILMNLYDKTPEQVKKEKQEETIARLYFEDLLLEAVEDGEKRVGVVLADGPVNRLFVKGADGWHAGVFTDEEIFANARKEKLVIPREKIHRTEIGFMHPFKDKEVVFKTKDLTQKRNNLGAKCTDASKHTIASKIGVILGQTDMYTATQIEKPDLCVMLEIIMRWKTEARDVYYFFRPEQTNEMKISTMHW